MLHAEAYWAHLLCATSSAYCVNPSLGSQHHLLTVVGAVVLPVVDVLEGVSGLLLAPGMRLLVCVRRGRSWDRGLHSSWGQLEEQK